MCLFVVLVVLNVIYPQAYQLKATVEETLSILNLDVVKYVAPTRMDVP